MFSHPPPTTSHKGLFGGSNDADTDWKAVTHFSFGKEWKVNVRKAIFSREVVSLLLFVVRDGKFVRI